MATNNDIKLKNALETIDNLNVNTQSMNSTTHVPGNSDGLYAMINKMNMTIDKIAHGIRSPTSKYYNAQAMLIANGHNPKNRHQVRNAVKNNPFFQF